MTVYTGWSGDSQLEGSINSGWADSLARFNTSSANKEKIGELWSVFWHHSGVWLAGHWTNQCLLWFVWRHSNLSTDYWPPVLGDDISRWDLKIVPGFFYRSDHDVSLSTYILLCLSTLYLNYYNVCHIRPQVMNCWILPCGNFKGMVHIYKLLFNCNGTWEGF